MPGTLSKINMMRLAFALFGMAQYSNVLAAPDDGQMAPPPSGVRTWLPACKEAKLKHPERHIIGGDGQNACLFEDLPPGFDPYSASGADLLNWGLPKRPQRASGETTQSFEARQEEWLMVINNIVKYGRNHNTYLCTPKRQDFLGPPDVWQVCNRRGNMSAVPTFPHR